MCRIMGRHRNDTWEPIDEFDDRTEALQAMRKYSIAFGPEWTMRLRMEVRA